MRIVKQITAAFLAAGMLMCMSQAIQAQDVKGGVKVGHWGGVKGSQ